MNRTAAQSGDTCVLTMLHCIIGPTESIMYPHDDDDDLLLMQKVKMLVSEESHM